MSIMSNIITHVLLIRLTLVLQRYRILTPDKGWLWLCHRPGMTMTQPLGHSTNDYGGITEQYAGYLTCEDHDEQVHCQFHESKCYKYCSGTENCLETSGRHTTTISHRSLSYQSSITIEQM